MSGSRTHRRSPLAADPREVPPFTVKQGQYLVSIYYYTKIHGTPPADSDFRHFESQYLSCITMIMTRETRGFTDRVSGTARSIRLRLRRA